MRRALAAAVLALGVLAPPAVAGEYDPGTVPPESTQRPAASGRVLHVGRGGIQAAVDRARAGDTVRIGPGTYRGTIDLRGASRRGLRLVADRATLRGGLRIRDTAAITVRGLAVRGSIALDGVDRYVLDRLRVSGGGIGVRRSAGGTITRTLVQGSRGAGISLSSSPPAVRAVRTFVRDCTVRDSAVGVAIDRMRAVTVSRVRLLGNAAAVSASATTELVLADNLIHPPESS
jgi:hypothetical protein